MATGTSFCLIVCFLVCSCTAQKMIPPEKTSAELGENVILPCKAPNKKITALEWIRPDQDPEYVLLYRDGHLDLDSQHPSYQNRVDLQDKEMKDRDVSLILKNVTMEDTGRYECWVFEEGKNEHISIINLEVVEPPGDTEKQIMNAGDKGGVLGDGEDKDGGGMVGIIVGSVVGVILLVVASGGFLIYRRPMKKNPNLPPAIETPTVHESTGKPPTASVPLMEPPAEEQAVNVN